MDAWEQFLQAANKIGEEPVTSEALKGDWPPWMQNVVMRFARVFTPELKADDFKNRPEIFFGSLSGMIFRLAKEAEEIEIVDVPDNPVSKLVNDEMQWLRDSELPLLHETVAAAGKLSGEKAAAFHRAFAAALNGSRAEDFLEDRWRSQTVRICSFLIGAYRWIDRGDFKSISALFAAYVKLDELTGGHSCSTDQSKRSFEKQFRKICSESGLRLRGRGRPKKM